MPSDPSFAPGAFTPLPTGGPAAAPRAPRTELNLAPFFRLCLLVSRDLHAHLYQRVIMHPDIPREAAWKRLRNAYWQASSALSGRGASLDAAVPGERPADLDSVSEFPLLVERLALATEAMQAEIEAADWGRELFPPPGLGDLGAKELRRLLALL